MSSAAPLSVTDRHALVERMGLTEPSAGENVLPPRATFVSSLGRQSLNGSWRFRWSPDPGSAPVGVESEEFDDGDFDELVVPSSWPMHGFGHPAYTNVQFPFPVDPPHPPEENPIGDHRLRFDLDDELADRLLDGAVLRFDGVDNAGEVWLNGIRLGTTRGSRLPQEFDVKETLRRHGNVLVVRVAQFSATSYVEDQDMWWLPGIFRDVTVIPLPGDAVRDVRVQANFSDGTGELRVEVDAGRPARVEIAELGISGGPGETLTAPVDPWSPESPRLYDLVVSTELESVTLRVGFRTVSVADSQIMINGRPILIKGVNRHEHHPDLGRVVPPEVVRGELELMKQHNINAIRTSHYPPHPLLLELADELGFYVLDECDLETHGFVLNGWRRNPSDDPVWTDALVSRVQAMVARDRNHPAIFCWSMGNEAGVGRNLAAMAQAAREADPSRLIHYEGDLDMPFADVFSQMYASVDFCEQVGQGSEPATSTPELDAHRRSLPFLLCEYAHAMGNGPGGLTEYQQLFERYPRLNGGFIWEWLEHGIRMELAGEPCFGYGGDFGEEVHDGVFVIDGLVSADREPRPSMADLKKVYEPVRIDVADDWRSVSVRNGYDAVGLERLEFRWSVERDGDRAAEGTLSVGACPAGRSVRVELPDECRPLRQPGAVLSVTARLAADASWAARGHEVAWGQQAVPATADPIPAPSTEPTVASRSGAGGGVAFGPARFDPATGELAGLGPVAVSGPRLSLWRAPIDNDHGWAGETTGSDAESWRRLGLDRLQVRVDSAAVEGAAWVVRQWVAAATADRGVEVTYRWQSDGDRIGLHTELRPVGDWPGSWPRIGLELELPLALGHVGWTGRGPGQAYPDTGQGARAGTFAATVADLQVPYVRPQENGSRRATVLRLDDADGHGLTVSAAGREFGFAARPWSTQTLTTATHTPDLVADGALHLVLDHRQHGVGTAACGPGVLPAYRLVPAELGAEDLAFDLVFAVH